AVSAAFSLYYQFFGKKKVSFSTVNMIYLYIILAGTLSIVSFIAKLIASSFEFGFINIWSWFWAVLLERSVFFILLAIAFQSLHQDSYIPETLAERVVAIFVVFGLFIFYIAVFARGVYNEIPSGFGGGRPDQVSFIVDATSKPYLQVENL